MKRKVEWHLNLISGGNYEPFVYREEDGIHVGDTDNHEIFQTVADAMDYAKEARLSRGELSRIRAASKYGLNSSQEAEYLWHEDAGLQMDALKTLE